MTVEPMSVFYSGTELPYQEEQHAEVVRRKQVIMSLTVQEYNVSKM